MLTVWPPCSLGMWAGRAASTLSLRHGARRSMVPFTSTRRRRAERLHGAAARPGFRLLLDPPPPPPSLPPGDTDLSASTSFLFSLFPIADTAPTEEHAAWPHDGGDLLRLSIGVPRRGAPTTPPPLAAWTSHPMRPSTSLLPSACGQEVHHCCGDWDAREQTQAQVADKEGGTPLSSTALSEVCLLQGPIKVDFVLMFQI
jgi:hypothetical protein